MKFMVSVETITKRELRWCPIPETLTNRNNLYRQSLVPLSCVGWKNNIQKQDLNLYKGPCVILCDFYYTTYTGNVSS